MTEKITSLKKKLLQKVNSYLTKSEVTQVQTAIKIAEHSHQNQFRASGNPYICHPLEVSLILANLEQDCYTVIGGILHDTIEDTDTSLDDIKVLFGSQVEQLVAGVTKLGKLQFNSTEELQAENYRRMLLAMANDIRVIIIKLADRLHNMKTLKYLAQKKQNRIAKETLEIYAPLAHRLGMAHLKWELEDLSFFYTNYKDFQKIKKLVDMKRSHREDCINEFIDVMKKIMVTYKIKGAIEGRPKHFYSIYRKMKKSGLNFEELYDTLGVRIIVNSIQDCYTLLGAMHAKFVPINGRFKDYIALPKSNMYQSLHTTLIGPKGKAIEIQIRTTKMHQIAEYGVAAHWHYKDGEEKAKLDKDFSWLRQFLDEDTQTIKPKEFLKNLKSELFTDEIFVFTPNGDVMFLAKGAIPIDFAYRIHSEVGNLYHGAKVNGHIVPINYRLKSGDQIEILTSKKSFPKLDWLQWVKTRHAKNKIKQWIKLQQRSTLLEQGKAKLSQLCTDHDISYSTIEEHLNHSRVLDKFKIKDKEELILMIAQGECSVKKLVSFISKDILKLSIYQNLTQGKSPSPKSPTTQNNIIVLGEQNIQTTLAKCCSPLPGDEIIGVIVPNKGVSIHRETCAISVELEKTKKDRLVSVMWDLGTTKSKYTIALTIEAFDRVGLLQDILGIISEKNINMVDLKTIITKDKNKMKSKIILQVNHANQVTDLKKNLLAHPDVIYVGRG